MGVKETVRLRERTMANGQVSLYLDVYLNGKRTYEFLKLYLVPEKTKADKARNKETLKLAEAIKAKRTVEIQNHEFGFKDDFELDMLFGAYYDQLCQARLGVESRGNWGNWLSAKRHMQRYDPNWERLTFRDITPEWVKGFREYLDKRAIAHDDNAAKKTQDQLQYLSENSKYSYFNKLRACLNQAYEERIIPHNPMRGIEGFRVADGTRMYLTIEEVKLLAQTECGFPEIKRAFLFSCLTGLRRSDIVKLTWSEVHQQGDHTRLIFKQKKTGGQEYLDINQQAADLIGTERGKPDDPVFGDILCTSATNHYIKLWCARAGIHKEITFHCGRHTFATMMLDLGADIYTVSKLLGHRELTTTQIYAKVMDKNKQAAVDRIPDIF